MFRRILHRLQDTPPYDDFAQSVPAMAPTIPPCTHNGRPRMLLHHPKRLKKNNNNNTVIDSTGTAHALGERLITLHTVRNSVDQASLWNTITMEVTSYFLFDMYNDKIEETYLSCRTSENENMGYAFNNNGNVNSKISISEYMEEKHEGSVRNVVVAYNLLGANERGAFSRFLANLSRYCMSYILTLFRLCCMEVVNIVVEYCIQGGEAVCSYTVQSHVGPA
ncbi:hypothetical protein GQX74_010559 [Glossina fuscipes]|nr:hypothetical protein GQX74_010559 [Glossina fuscipes]